MGEYIFDYTITLDSSKYTYICGVSKKFCEWYHKTNKTEDTNN
jgi:hypothetical protein